MPWSRGWWFIVGVGVSTENFYQALCVLPSFERAMDVAAHADVPDDWWVVVTDVVDSTRAIARGDYKQVNTVGVASIAAVANVHRGHGVPYVFGGDGAVMAVPSSWAERVLEALRGAQNMAQEAFGLSLRAGLVRVADLRCHGHWVRLAKVPLGPDVVLPVLSGRGWAEAERWVKEEGAASVWRVQADGGPARADFEGFECRWQHVPSFRGHKLTMIVAATSTDPALNQATYQRVLAELQTLLGAEEEHHPLRVSALRLTGSLRALQTESGVHAPTGWSRVVHVCRLYALHWVGRWLFWRHRGDPDSVWGRYRSDLVRQTDFRKFDGALRMVVDVSAEQAEAWQVWLERARQDGHLVYGLHRSSAALITCLVESYEGRHLHFVDGSDGGYALAAQQLKRQWVDQGRSRAG